MARRAKYKQRSSKPIVLDTFSEADIERWSSRSEAAQHYFDHVYFDLERQRVTHHADLVDSLRRVSACEFDIANWCRVVDYQWSLTPLSPAGSLRQIGGRFNVGMDLDRARRQHFPALYIAADVDTAYREYFGGQSNDQCNGLTLMEYALRKPSSFSTFRLSGKVYNIFDLRTASPLKDFSKILNKFKVSSATHAYARKYGLKARPLLRTPRQIHEWVCAEPKRWRTEPQLFGIPAANQILGSFIRDAGFEGILYRSQRGDGLCMAVFPTNFSNSDSEITVVGSPPPGASCLILSKLDHCLHGC